MSFAVFILKHLLGQIYPWAVRIIFYRNCNDKIGCYHAFVLFLFQNDLSQLRLSIEKWRSCSQQLLYELQSAMSEENKKLSLTQLIDHYGLDDKLLHYNRNEEEFIGV